MASVPAVQASQRTQPAFLQAQAAANPTGAGREPNDDRPEVIDDFRAVIDHRPSLIDGRRIVALR